MPSIAIDMNKFRHCLILMPLCSTKIGKQQPIDMKIFKPAPAVARFVGESPISSKTKLAIEPNCQDRKLTML